MEQLLHLAVRVINRGHTTCLSITGSIATPFDIPEDTRYMSRL
ncbi:MAG: hypothetical protein ACYDGM_00910 [Vulcanimicrobiaceae bacterium]